MTALLTVTSLCCLGVLHSSACVKERLNKEGERHRGLGGRSVPLVCAIMAPRNIGMCTHRTKAAGVNRADCMQREGKYPPPAGASTVIGLECCGTVQEACALRYSMPCFACRFAQAIKQ